MLLSYRRRVELFLRLLFFFALRYRGIIAKNLLWPSGAIGRYVTSLGWMDGNVAPLGARLERSHSVGRREGLPWGPGVYCAWEEGWQSTPPAKGPDLLCLTGAIFTTSHPSPGAVNRTRGRSCRFSKSRCKSWKEKADLQDGHYARGAIGFL